MRRPIGFLAALSLGLVLCGGVRGEERTDKEKRADECLAQALEKLRQMPDAESHEERRRLAREVGDLFARACHHDQDCDQRFFERLKDAPEADNKPLRAMIRSQFARGYCANKRWDKALGNIDKAIGLNTRSTPFYRRLKQEILRRKKKAEEDKSADD